MSKSDLPLMRSLDKQSSRSVAVRVAPLRLTPMSRLLLSAALLLGCVSVLAQPKKRPSLSGASSKSSSSEESLGSQLLTAVLGNDLVRSRRARISPSARSVDARATCPPAGGRQRHF